MLGGGRQGVRTFLPQCCRRLLDGQSNYIGGNTINRENKGHLAGTSQRPGDSHVYLIEPGVRGVGSGVRDLRGDAADFNRYIGQTAVISHAGSVEDNYETIGL